MSNFTPKQWVLTSLSLSLLLHLLLLLFFLRFSFFNQEKRKQPHLYVPAYTYESKASPSIQQHPAKSIKTQSATGKESEHKKYEPMPKAEPGQASIMLASLKLLDQEQHEALTSQKESDPIYLIGDDSQPADPLIKLLAKALSANFEYPRMAGQFGIQGRAVIGMTLHPDGNLTDVELLFSSHNRDLDAAALYAVNAAPLVQGANRFISKPQHFIIGFLFRFR